MGEYFSAKVGVFEAFDLDIATFIAPIVFIKDSVDDTQVLLPVFCGGIGSSSKRVVDLHS